MSDCRWFRRRLGVFAVLLPLLSACESSEDKISAYLASARELQASNEEEKARLQLRNVLELDRRNVEANLMMAESYADAQDWRRAVGHLQEAIAGAPEDVEARFKLVRLLLATGSVDEAEAQLSAVEALAADDPRTIMLRGVTLARRGNAVEAQALTERAFRAAPGDSEIVAAHAAILLMHGKAVQALGVVTQGLEHHPDDTSLRLLQFEALAAEGRQERATEVLRSVLEREPERLPVWRALAIYLMRNDDTAGAEAALREMVRANPGSVDAKLMLAGFLGQNDLGSAIEALKSFVSDPLSADNRLRFALGEAFLQGNALGEASDVFLDIATATGTPIPERLIAQNQIARIALKQNDKREAAAIVAEILSADARNPDALLTRAMIALSERRADDAIFDLRLVLRERPDSDQANVLLGRAYLQNGAVELAERGLFEALKINPLNEQAAVAYAQMRISRQDYAGALKVLDTLASGGAGSADAERLRLQILLAQRDWRQATDVGGRIADRERRPAFARYVMGLTLQGQQKYREAIDIFTEVVEEDPSLLGAAAGVAQAHASLGNAARGVEWLRKFADAAPEVLERRMLLANQLLQTGQKAAAVAELESVIVRDPNRIEAHKLLGSVALRDGDTARAMAAYERGLAANPDSIELQLLLAGALESAGDKERAMALYAALLQRIPTLDVAANNYAVLLAGDGSDPQRLAEAHGIAARFASSSNPWYADTLGWILHLQGKYAEAEKLLSRAVEGAPDEALFRYHLGASLVELDRLQEAKPHLQRAESLAREHGEFEGFDGFRLLLSRLPATADPA